MKKSIWLLSLLWVLVLSWCGWSNNVEEYNDAFVSIVRECTDANKALFETYQTKEVAVDVILETLQSNIDICNSAREKALDMWNFKWDSSLKDGVVDLLTMEVEYLQKFWSTKNYWNIDNLTDEDKVAYDWIVSDLNETQNALNQQFVNLQGIQEAFAAKYQLLLVSQDE